MTFVICSQAQTSDETSVLYKKREVNSGKSLFFKKPLKPNFGIQMGTSVGTDFRNGAVWSNYFAPQVSYQVNPRFNVNIGTMFASHQFNTSLRTGEGFNSTPARSLQTFVYTQGQYMVSERVRLTGTAFYELNQFSQPRMNAQATNFQSKGASMHADFKITDNFSVGAGVQISNGNPYLRNGLYNNSMGFPSSRRFNAW